MALPSGSDTAATVTVVGEALIDLVPAGGDALWRAAPGGSPANVAVGLARLGVRTRMGARLSGDVFGRQLRRHLAGNGVDLSAAVDAAEPSSLAIVSVDPDGSVEYEFRVAGTADWQWTAPELDRLLPAPDDAAAALHTGSLAAVTPPGAAQVLRLMTAARTGATVSYDPNCRPLLMGEPATAAALVEAAVRASDVVKASEEDLRWLHPDLSPEQVAVRWSALGPALVAVTLGARGAFAVSAAGTVTAPGVPVTVEDTVGAGDSFMAALLAGLAGRDLLGAARRPRLRAVATSELTALLHEAITASALTCTRPGADPPRRDELLAALNAGADPHGRPG